MPDSLPAKVACLKGATALFYQTGDRQFLQLGKDVMANPSLDPSGTVTREVADAIEKVHGIFRVRDSHFSLHMAEAAVKACKIVWPDSAFPQLDPEVISILASAQNYTKHSIPPSYYRGFLVFWAQLAGSLEGRDQDDDDDDVPRDNEFADVIEAAFAKAEEIYGKYITGLHSGALFDGPPYEADAYIRGGIASNRILYDIKEIVEVIAKESERMVETDEEATFGLDDLEVLHIREGENVPAGMLVVRQLQASHTSRALKTLNSNIKSLWQFVGRSISIIRDSKEEEQRPSTAVI